MKKNGQWTIINSKVTYKNKHHLKVIEDEVIQPDGSAGLYTTLQIRDGVFILPLDENDNVYLLNEFKYPLGKETLTTIGGYVEENEPVIEAAKRELREEAGILAEEFIDLGFIHPAPSSSASKSFLYLARKLSFTKTEHEPTEIICVTKMKLGQALKNVMDCKISHASGTALVLKANEYLKGQHSFSKK